MNLEQVQAFSRWASPFVFVAVVLYLTGKFVLWVIGL